MYIYHYARHHIAETRKYDTLDKALESAAQDLEFDLAWPKMITTESGEVVYDSESIRRVCRDNQS